MVFIFPGVKGFDYNWSDFVGPMFSSFNLCQSLTFASTGPKQFQYLNLVLPKRDNYFWNSIDPKTRFSFSVR